MLAYDVRDDYEIIEGVKFMSPSPNIRHSNVAGKLFLIIGNYSAINKFGICFGDHMDVHFPDGNLFQPDFVFVSAANDKIVIDNKHKTIHGSTMKRDMTIKKDVYERNGVKEYWIIDPWRESIEVYLLRDGKYFLDEIYFNYSDAELSELTDAERAEVKMEIPVAVLDGFKVKIRNIFGWYFE